MNAGQAVIESSLRASKLFGVLGPDAFRSLTPHVKRRRFERGARMWRAGEEATWMALITSGLVKIVQPGGAILTILGPHETFGELAIVGDSAYSADAVAATRAVELLCIDADAIRAATQSNIDFARAMSRALVVHGRELHEKIRIMSAGCVERRLAELLRHLLDRFGDELEDGSIVIQISLSRAELANLVGATIETTIRIMSRWSKQGIVSTVDDGFVVHSLRRLAEILAMTEIMPSAPAPLSR
jgi:CRP/FNR family transcriptional regulator